MHQHGSKYFAHISKVSFSEHGHAADQIKGNHKCSNMQAHILSLHTCTTSWLGSKVKHLSESSHVAYQINWNGAY